MSRNYYNHCRRNRYRRHSRKRLPKTFGMNEAIGVSFFAIREAFRTVGSFIERFNEARNSVHYDI